MLGFLASYLIGSIPFAVIVARLHDADVQKVGSRNPGFANAVRTIGLVKSLPVLVGDVGKGALGAIAALALGGGWWSAAGAILGHCFSPWLKFGGGKGVAPFLGIALVAFPIVGLCALALWLVVTLHTRKTSLASYTAVLFSIAALWIFSSPAAPALSLAALLIFFKHRHNMVRLLQSREYTV